MGTKRLSRTAIEGGRAGYNKCVRRGSNDRERAHVRGELRKLLVDADLGDDVVIEPRDPVAKDFADKLGPARRWLRKQVGRNWSEVYGDLKRAFDPRTTAGRHLVYDHMLRWVVTAQEHTDHQYFGPRWFYIDEEGVLRQDPRRYRYVREDWRTIFDDRERARSFVAGRKIGERGSCLFWFVRADRDGLHYRQDRRLLDDEVRTWRCLHAEVRKELLYVADGGRSSWDVIATGVAARASGFVGFDSRMSPC